MSTGGRGGPREEFSPSSPTAQEPHKKGAPVIPGLVVQGLRSHYGSKTFVLCDRLGRGTIKKSEGLNQKAGAGAGSQGAKGESRRL